VTSPYNPYTDTATPNPTPEHEGVFQGKPIDKSGFGQIDFDFVQDFKVRFGKFGFELDGEEHGPYKAMITSREGIRQMRNFLKWKKELPAHELRGRAYAHQMLHSVETAKGTFLRDEKGEYHIILEGRRIPIDREANTMRVFIDDICQITRNSPEAAVAIEKLRVEASKRCSKMTFRRFSAMYKAGLDSRIYLPVQSGELLCISTAGCDLVANGANTDALWLEHPEEAPFEWSKLSPTDTRAALREFEKLLVDSQACEVPAMSWFVAMAEGLFPVVRDATENRFIMLHTGRKGHGKTTGAKAFRLLHGFRNVLLDVSVAGLSNLPEQGLAVIDNKEQHDFSPELVNYFLSMATGGDRLRSLSDGSDVRRNAPHPVGVITSIEGVRKDELYDRCVEVKYFLADKQQRLDRDDLEEVIVKKRNRIMSALAVVLQEYLVVREDPDVHIGVRPIERFNRHFRDVCYLLIAYARVMQGKDLGDAWAMEKIQVWATEIQRHRSADGGAPASALESPILRIIKDRLCECKTLNNIRWRGTPGTLYVMYPGDLLLALKGQHNSPKDLPSDTGGMGKRLRNDHFERFDVVAGDELKDTDDPTVQTALKRKKTGQRIGIFVPEEDGGDGAEDADV
jgi:hypothetical protein